MNKFLPLFFVLCTLKISAQVNFISSNLPIVVINTGGAAIPDEPKITATMGIINNPGGARNYLTDAHNEYDGNIGIEVRGQSSQMFPMKSYSVELRDANGEDNDKSLFGMPEESDWVMYAPYTDKTLMRNFLAYTFSNDMGHWAAHCRFVEVMLNGEYIGVYVFMEKIKRDKGRINIKKLEPEDTDPEAITGGYIFSIDKGADAWYSAYPAPVSGNPIQFKYEYPAVEDINQVQKDYLKAYVDSFETALKSKDYQDSVKGFRNFADEHSFIDYFIVNELSRNVDGYRISTFLHKDRNDVYKKIIMGPVWDYDLAFRNADYCNGSNLNGWAYKFNNVCPFDGLSIPFWWNRFMQDTAFEANLLCRWKAVRQTNLSAFNINRLIDSVAALVDEARQRHFTKWPVLGQYVWPNPQPIPDTYAGEISTLKAWIGDRLAWIDANLPQIGACKGLVLPLQLISFTGNRVGNIATLRWYATAESNIKGYEVQYAYDGIKFNTAGFVNTSASAGTANTYTFSHNPGVTGGKLFYRLKIITNDGEYTFSDVLDVSQNKKVLFAITPNPGHGNFIIKGDASVDDVNIAVYTMQGEKIGSAQGNTVTLSRILNRWLTNQAKGIYVVKLYSNNFTQTLKLNNQ